MSNANCRDDGLLRSTKSTKNLFAHNGSSNKSGIYKTGLKLSKMWRLKANLYIKYKSKRTRQRLSEFRAAKAKLTRLFTYICLMI